jgi:hypothetical protein
MNRSNSKIRHIQEANLKLEQSFVDSYFERDKAPDWVTNRFKETKPKVKTKPKTKSEIINFQNWVINTKKDKQILGNSGADGIWGQRSELAWNRYGAYYNPTIVKTNTDKSKTNKSIFKTPNDVRKFQNWVIKVKKDTKILGPLGADGDYGPSTKKAWVKYGGEYYRKIKSSPNLEQEKSTSFYDTVLNFFKSFTENKSPSANSSLLFDGDSLIWMSDNSEIKRWDATSGVNLLNAEPNQWLDVIKKPFITTQELQKLPNFGPTPEGQYYVGKLQTSKLEKTNPFMDFVNLVFKSGQSNHDWNKNTASTRISWGYYRAPIIPKSGTDTYGRSNFYVHGGALPASHGCIDLTSDMENFAKFYSAWAAKFKKDKIPLKVKYSKRLIDRIL